MIRAFCRRQAPSAPRHTRAGAARGQAVGETQMQDYLAREGIRQPAQGEGPKPLGAQGVAPRHGNR
jgi:hypothetical protein